jgi:hypothetical protein
VAGFAGAKEPGAGENPNLGRVRHVVLFKFKDGTTPEQIKSVEDAFRALPSKVPAILDFEWGTNMSPEKLDQGFTHCFFLTFKTPADRDAYCRIQTTRRSARSSASSSTKCWSSTTSPKSSRFRVDAAADVDRPTSSW